MTWEPIEPFLWDPKNYDVNLIDFGFLRPHPFWSGVPIPEFVEVLEPTAPDPAMAPARLEIKNTQIEPDEVWTGGNFGIYITRTPTLFHALHFKSDMPDDKLPNRPVRPRGIEPRSEINITEREFWPRSPLIGKASEAGPQLFEVTFDKLGGSPTIGEVRSSIEFNVLDSKPAITEAVKEGYFETIGTVDEPDEWTRKHLHKVGPLNAVWLFILAHNAGVETPSLAIARLGRGHRFWHVRDHEDPKKRDGYEMDASRWEENTGKDKFKRIKFEIELCGALNKGRKECPDEKVVLSFEIEWS